MNGNELTMACWLIGMTVEEFARHAGVSDRTARRWAKAEKLRGPVVAMIKAWVQCHRHGLDYGPVAFIGSYRHDSRDWMRV